MPSVNLTICKKCGCNITDPRFQAIFINPDFPTIDIGPYCMSCMGQVRLCSGCDHPFFGNDIKQYPKGKWFCSTCAENLQVCELCHEDSSVFVEHDGVKYCTKCFTKVFFECSSCGKVHKKTDHVYSELQKQEWIDLFSDYPNCCFDCFNSKKKDYNKKSVLQCTHCSKVYFEGASGSTGKYCAYCYSRFKECSMCKDKNPTVRQWSYNNKYGDSTTEYFCNSCKKTHLKTCYCCGGLGVDMNSVKSLFFGTNSICKRCVRNESLSGPVDTCPRCGKMKSKGKEVCKYCDKAYVRSKCSNCGRVKDWEGYCRVCDNTKVYNYSSKPRLFTHYTDKDIKTSENIVLGFENEMYFPGRKNKALRDLYSAYDPRFLLAKSDGSIPDDGFEVVTQPMTPGFFNQFNLAPLFTNNPKFDRSCGLHVHVNRQAFLNSQHIYKVCKFIHTESGFVDKIVGRSAGSYNSNFRAKASKVICEEKKGNCIEGRHSRINLTGQHTIEFRMFATAVTEQILRYRIEFLVALIRWARDLSLSDITVDSFTKYVMNNKKNYSNLVVFLNNN